MELADDCLFLSSFSSHKSHTILRSLVASSPICVRPLVSAALNNTSQNSSPSLSSLSRALTLPQGTPVQQQQYHVSHLSPCACSRIKYLKNTNRECHHNELLSRHDQRHVMQNATGRPSRAVTLLIDQVCFSQ